MSLGTKWRRFLTVSIIYDFIYFTLLYLGVSFRTNGSDSLMSQWFILPTYSPQDKWKRFTSVFPPAGNLLSWLDTNYALRLIEEMCAQVRPAAHRSGDRYTDSLSGQVRCWVSQWDTIITWRGCSLNDKHTVRRYTDSSVVVAVFLLLLAIVSRCLKRWELDYRNNW